MRRALYHKIKSKNGATIVLVLVLFLLCVMVSSVIVTAAASGASRNANRNEQQKAYLAIMSAVELIQEEMESAGSYQGKIELLDYGCNEYDWDHNPNVQIGPKHYVKISTGTAHDDNKVEETADRTGSDSNLGGALKELLNKACTSIYINRTPEYTIEEIIIKADSDRLPDVKCKFTMSSEYHITMVFSVADGSSPYTVILEYKGTMTENGRGASVTLSCTHNIEYKELVGGVYSDKTGPQDFNGTQETITTTITWNTPTLKRGGMD